MATGTTSGASGASNSTDGGAADPDSDDWVAWAATLGVVGGWLGLHFVLARCFKVGQVLTFSVLERQHDVTAVKDTVRNIWTNIALIGALLLTLATPLVMDSHVLQFSRTRPALTKVYVMMAATSALQFAETTVECIIHLIYTEALTASGTMRYFIQSHTCIGGPMLVFCMGSLNILATMGTWAFMTYGGPAFVSGIVAVLSFVSIICWTWVSAIFFSPDPDHPHASGWVWVTREDPPLRPWWDRFVHASYSKDQLKILKQRATAAARLEEQQDSNKL